MTMPLTKNNPWMGTVRLLSCFSEPQTEAAVFRHRRQALPVKSRGNSAQTSTAANTPDTLVRPATVVLVLERPTRTTASVYWSDPSHCHYAQQPWRAGSAATDGFCALSGRAIHRGDVVFRPSKIRLGLDPAPANAEAMILAAAMPEPEPEIEEEMADH